MFVMFVRVIVILIIRNTADAANESLKILFNI